MKKHISKEEVEKFYKVHEIKPFYNDLAHIYHQALFVMILQKKMQYWRIES